VVQCPADQSVNQPSVDQFHWGGCEVATTSYKGVLDDTFLGQRDGGTYGNDATQFPSGKFYKRPPWPGYRDCHRGTQCRGIFFRHSWLAPVKMAQITDGTSKTLMIGEDVPDYNWHSVAFYGGGDWSSCNLPLNLFMNLPPGRPDPDTGKVPKGHADPTAWWDAVGFRSRHPGGVHFAACDGSVHFFAETMDNVVYRTSCTRDAGEPPAGSF
jgi:prepilin-type processing-associated H-X9-DG protein